MNAPNPRPSRRTPAVFRPLIAFLETEAAGGILLLAAAAAALAWANSPWSGSYERVWRTELTLGIGSTSISTDLRHWVNDALMAIFFFVVGLEIKRELAVGELRARRAAALPVFAAIGGMVVPAGLYLAINAGGAGERGWGIPMATDIAFAVGVLALVGRKAPASLKIFLLSLAIVDDIGAIAVIAIFYAETLSIIPLAVAAALFGAIAACRRLGVRPRLVYLALGLGVWLAVFESGVHATIAGVALGLFTPARSRAASDGKYGSSSLDRLEAGLHPWTSFFIVPLFALANAGVDLTGGAALGDRVALGVIIGLVAGKTIGIALAAWGATRLGFARLPADIGWRHIFGGAAVAGIGFTVSLLIAGLAFEDPGVLASAKLGILTASVGAGVLGAAILSFAGRPDERAGSLTN